jgi:hypothetical protein
MSLKICSEDTTLNVDFHIKNAENIQWYTELDICKNPTCSCNDVTIELYDSENKDSALPVHRISMDVFKQKAVKLKGKTPTTREDFRLATSFVKNLTDDDWRQLRKIFLAFKLKITNKTPINNLIVSFPEKRIEKDGMMIGYADILPYAEQIWFDHEDIHYIIFDQYCLSYTCSCTHTALTFLAIKNERPLNKNSPLSIIFDYKTNSYKVEGCGTTNIATPKELVNKILHMKLGKVFKERHKKLRDIYANFRSKKRGAIKRSLNQSRPKLINESISAPKAGRNQPCPCGSGKKYKKCCMLKQ